MSRHLARNARDLKTAILAVFPDLVRQWLPVGELRGQLYFALNPTRYDRKLGSFQVNLVTGRWRDHAIGVGGSDGVSLYAYLFEGGSYRSATKALSCDPLVRAALITGAAPLIANTAKALSSPAERVQLARRIYEAGTPLSGTPAERYLQSRGLHNSKAWEPLRAAVLRYPGRGYHPALIAPIRALDGTLMGVHRTYLQPTGRKLND